MRLLDITVSTTHPLRKKFDNKLLKIKKMSLIYKLYM